MGASSDGPLLPALSQGGLGSRPSGFEPSMLDLRAYEYRRGKFLQSDRARAAALRGGIVWRLAMESFTREQILDGPTDLATSLYARMDGESEGAWDDQLSDEELDLICGVYKVYTGHRVFANQQAHFSWWPKHSTWMKSSMNVGWWTATCETWYQNRLKQLETMQQGLLRTPIQWDNALKIQKPARKFANALHKQSEAVLIRTDKQSLS
ncbi:hypothetical protein FIBSPDRAFT_732308 [Athelia psychrophila]|uniref:Uncharacterized protein n=1 Tax=Athelia psychrophila TaxID=1759441 RepID=A0A166PT32_9AGAM|nr:hypothetical protein FIBSPDRAFT_732308 [Fibularhizoctonia sp. CBS 109695]